MRGADVAREGEHQREGVLGGGNGVSGRGVHHDDSVVGGGIAVDVVHADSGAADGFEVLRGGEDFGSDLGFRADDKAVVVADDFQKLGR